MPRYEYLCVVCKDRMTVVHLSDETAEECPACGAIDSLKKLLTNFMMNKKNTTKIATGDITEAFIKDAKKDLKQQKRELKNKK